MAVKLQQQKQKPTTITKRTNRNLMTSSRLRRITTSKKSQQQKSKSSKTKTKLLVLILIICFLVGSFNIIFHHFFVVSSSFDELVDDVLLESKLKNSTKTTTTGRRRKSKSKIRNYDEVGIQPIHPSLVKCHRLPNAIPESRTIPKHLIENKLYHIQQRTNTTYNSIIGRPPKFKSGGQYDWINHNYTTDYRTLYQFNPSILPLIQQQYYYHNNNNTDTTNDYDDPDWLTKEDLYALTGGDKNVRYVVVFQVYLGCNCFGPDPNRALMKAGEQIMYVAMTLLDDNLNLIPNSDILFDINAGPGAFGHKGYWRQWRGDCRIFLFRRDIYLLCVEQLHRIRIERRKQSSSSSSSSPVPPNYGTRDDHTLPYRYPNIYGNGLDVTLLNVHRSLGGGKNFNMFRSPASSSASSSSSSSSFSSNNNNNQQQYSTGPYDYYVQLYPHPHKYRRINIPAHTDHNMIPFPRGGGDDGEEKWPFYEQDANTATNDENGTIISLPLPSFQTPDSIHPIRKCMDDDDSNDNKNKNNKSNNNNNCTNPKDVPFFPNKEHGTACCITLELNLTTATNTTQRQPQPQHVLVGISHVKLSPRTNFWKLDMHHRYDHFLKDQYVSRFVAYQSIPPFDIVARSGYWCLGHGNDSEGGGGGGDSYDNNQHNTLAGTRKNKINLTLFNQTFNCPPIHFPSGFSEHATDPNLAIIGYGINDCYPRIMVVHKDDIIKSLTGDL